jgi:Phosphotransferase enzyme family
MDGQSLPAGRALGHGGAVIPESGWMAPFPENRPPENRRSPGADPAGWTPVPLSAIDDAGRTWQVRRAWPVPTPGDYVLEVLSQGQPGVRGARLRQGRFKLVPADDPRLPALQAEAPKGEVISYRPYRQAVICAADRYIKVFQPDRAAKPAERCAQMDALLDPAIFTTPKILDRGSPGVIAFSSVPGLTLAELGRAEAEVSDTLFAGAWERWSRAWVAQQNCRYGRAAQSVLDSLPLHSAELEAANVWRRVNGWLFHNQNVPEAVAQGNSLRAAAEYVSMNLLRTAPDPLVWSHGDLHPKQIIATDGPSPPGLLDFDSTARAEAARDLAGLDVHLELHRRQGQLAPARYLTAHTQVLAVADELRVSPVRFRAYSDAIWLRLATSPLPGRFSLAIAALEERMIQPAVMRLTSNN